MKNILIIGFVFIITSLFSACHKVIDIDPISNVGVNSFYKNYAETNTALNGCYNGLQLALYNEWMVTELRSDNSLQGVPNSTSAPNIELNDLDMFTLNPTHPQVYNYWINTYRNIRSINYVLKSVGVTYTNGQTTMGDGTAIMDQAQKETLAGEALFLRAYHYFNLVRLFGNAFLITEPVIPQESKKTALSTQTDLYNFIIADLKQAIALLPNRPINQNPAANAGRATIWAAKSLLAKLNLTLGQKPAALQLLDDVINNSGHTLIASYADVFSIEKEMNNEIVFAVRYKAGGLGLGSPFANLFAPSSSGNAVVNNDGNGYNFPTADARGMYRYPASALGKDLRKDVTIAQYTATKPYVKKFLSQVVTRYDAENDFPVLRFSDILLMKAEAIGFDGSSGIAVGMINQVRARAGALDYTGSGDYATVFYKYPASGDYAITTEQGFKDALLLERRLEFGYENQRYFDMRRIGDAVAILKNHFASEYAAHYSKIVPAITLGSLQSMVTPDKLWLPIPQREIDTNNEITIPQNAGY